MWEKMVPQGPKVHQDPSEHQEPPVILERRETLVSSVSQEQPVFLEPLVYLDLRVLPERVDQRRYRQTSL